MRDRVQDVVGVVGLVQSAVRAEGEALRARGGGGVAAARGLALAGRDPRVGRIDRLPVDRALRVRCQPYHVAAAGAGTGVARVTVVEADLPAAGADALAPDPDERRRAMGRRVGV